VKDLKTLMEISETRKQVVVDCCDLVDAQVKTKGFIVKGAYRLVKAIKPGIISQSIDGLLDEFIEKMQPFYERYQQDGEEGTVSEYFRASATDLAEALLTVTDERANRSSHRTMVKAYKKLRPKGKEHVALAAPGIGQVLDKHVGSL